MSLTIKNGTRLKSQVCDTEAIVVRYAESLLDLRCGGAPMVGLDVDLSSSDRYQLDPKFAEGTQIGKRYVDDNGAEVLVTQSGLGSLSIGDAAMHMKEAKPLPASD